MQNSLPEARRYGPAEVASGAAHEGREEARKSPELNDGARV